jgi:hypothetical protein
MASLSRYGNTIKLHSSDALVVHRTQNNRVAILEYEVHGKILSTGAPYDNRFVSVVTIENTAKALIMGMRQKPRLSAPKNYRRNGR